MLIMNNLGVTMDEHVDVLRRWRVFDLGIARFLIPLRITGAVALEARLATNNKTEQSERSFILEMAH